MRKEARNAMSLTKKLILVFLPVNVVLLGVIIWVSHRTLLEQAISRSAHG
jgi:hypothetical protein